MSVMICLWVCSFDFAVKNRVQKCLLPALPRAHKASLSTHRIVYMSSEVCGKLGRSFASYFLPMSVSVKLCPYSNFVLCLEL